MNKFKVGQIWQSRNHCNEFEVIDIDERATECSQVAIRRLDEGRVIRSCNMYGKFYPDEHEYFLDLVKLVKDVDESKPNQENKPSNDEGLTSTSDQNVGNESRSGQENKRNAKILLSVDPHGKSLAYNLNDFHNPFVNQSIEIDEVVIDEKMNLSEREEGYLKGYNDATQNLATNETSDAIIAVEEEKRKYKERLRDEIATSILNGLLASPKMDWEDEPTHPKHMGNFSIAKSAYQYADAMLAAREDKV